MVPAPLPETNATGGMTLEEVLDIALQNNPTIRQAAAALEGAEGTWVQVGLYPNPGIAYLGNQIGDRGTAGQQGAYFEQEFVRGGKLGLNREVANREIMIARQNFEAQRQRVINDVRIQFYNALVAQRQLEISHDLQVIGQRGLEVADKLFQAQQVGKVDVLQARIEASNAAIRITNAQNRLASSWRQLAAVSAVPGMQPEKLAGDLDADMPQFVWEESIGRILNESPELGATRTNVERAVEALRRARVEPVPNLTVQAGPQYDIGANHAITNVSVYLPVPVFNYNQGNIRKAEADVRAARSAVARHELVLTAQLAAAYERYGNARYQVSQYHDEIVPDAREALKLVGDAYRQGQTSFLVLLNAQRTYFVTVQAGLDAQRELWETAISIDGLLLTDSLQTGPTTIPTTPGIAPPEGMQLNPLLGH
jgi:cobalt-zinc-cadmium efflux system outer membrane protein